MTTPHHPRPWSDANARDVESGETKRGESTCRECSIDCTNNIHIHPSSRARGRVREIGGLQFPMDNGTLITP